MDAIVTFWIIKIKPKVFRFSTYPTFVSSLGAKTKILLNLRRLSQFYWNCPFQCTYLIQHELTRRPNHFNHLVQSKYAISSQFDAPNTRKVKIWKFNFWPENDLSLGHLLRDFFFKNRENMVLTQIERFLLDNFANWTILSISNFGFETAFLVVFMDLSFLLFSSKFFTIISMAPKIKVEKMDKKSFFAY